MENESTMKIFDSHCHLDDDSYNKDMDAVLARMKAAGVQAAMIAGIDENSCIKAIKLAETFDVLYASVGVHPHDSKSCNEKTIALLTQLSENQKVRAWGEIGLDFNRMFSPRVDQEKWFIRQIEIAKERNLPLIFHERDSEGRFLEILKHHFDGSAGGVIHCFSGNRNELEAYLDLGLYIGITGILTIQARGKLLRQLAPKIPADRIVIETDAPYLTPAPEKNRFRRNEPAFVKSVLLKLAEVRDEDPDELAEITWNNTCRLFHIDN